MPKKSEWQEFLQEQLKDPEFESEFKKEKAKLLAVKIALELAKARKAKSLNQEELAKLSGTTQSVISRLESGNYRGYSLKTLEKIAEALEYSIDFIFRPKKTA